jgi:queuine tRNA-ribosyltransferase
MFDCSMPSVWAKQGTAFTSAGRLNLYRSVYKMADEAVDAQCDCSTCARYSRAYLHHLAKTGEILGWQLLTRHNLRFYHRLTDTMRRHVVDDTFAAFHREQRDVLMRSDDAHPSVAPKVKRGRKGVRSMDRFDIRLSEHGWASVVDKRSGEIMHAGLDPNAEARVLYVEQSHLATRLREPVATPLVVWDVGLGAGHNAMAVLRCAESVGSARPIHLVSFENDLGSLRLALRNPAQFPHLQCTAPNHVQRDGSWRSQTIPFTWTLLDGDVRVRLPEAPTPDLVFYDPFSAETDRELWTLDCFEQLFAACGEHDTELFTYSASTAVRAGLLVAGFHVARGAATGTRAQTTLAMTPLAALRAVARGRVLLGATWLERWQRSDARFPRDVPPEAQAGFAARILEAPQFTASRHQH